MKNRTQLIGKVYGMPIIEMIGDKKMAKVTIITIDSHRNEKGNLIDTRNVHSLRAWGKTADIIEKNIIFGSEIAIEGINYLRTYIDKEGIKRHAHEIEISDILLLGEGFQDANFERQKSIQTELLEALKATRQFIVDHLDKLPDSKNVRMQALKAINHATGEVKQD